MFSNLPEYLGSGLEHLCIIDFVRFSNGFMSPQILYTSVVCAFLVAKVSPTLQPQGLKPSRLLCPRDSPGKNTEVGSHFLQGILPTQGSNLGLPHCRRILYCLSHQGSSFWDGAAALNSISSEGSASLGLGMATQGPKALLLPRR